MTKKELIDQLRMFGIYDTDVKITGVMGPRHSDNLILIFGEILRLLELDGYLDSRDWLYPMICETKAGKYYLPEKDVEIEVLQIMDAISALEHYIVELKGVLTDEGALETDLIDISTLGDTEFVRILRARKVTKADLERALELASQKQKQYNGDKEGVAKQHLDRLIDTVGTEKAIRALEQVDVDDDVPAK